MQTQCEPPNNTFAPIPILNKVMDKQNEDEIESFSKWMAYRGYENCTDLCVLIFIMNWTISMTSVTTE